MGLRRIFRRHGLSTKAEQQFTKSVDSGKGTPRSILHYHDVLCIVAGFIDVPSLLDLRMVDRQIHASLAEEENWICNAIAQQEYHWVWQSSADPSFRDPDNVPHHLSGFPTLKSVIRLHLATLLPLLLLWNTFRGAKGDQGSNLVLPGIRVSAACARGFLTLWKISDLEREIWETPSAYRARNDYFVLSKLAYPYVRGQPNHVPLDQGRADSTVIRRVASRLQSMATWRVRPAVIPRAGGDNLISPQETIAIGDAVRKDPETSQQLFRNSQATRRKLVATLDQGGWLDLHIVTTLVLAFYVAFTDSPQRRGRGVVANKLALSEWTLRQGPDVILGILSTNLETQNWTHAWIDSQWGARPSHVQEMEESWTDLGPLGISSATTGRYPHPRATEWEIAGYPPLAQCTKSLLFLDWETYSLNEDFAAKELARGLSDRTGDISFQTRV